MTPQSRKFEQLFIQRRDRIEKKGVSMVTSALRVQYKAFLSACDTLPPQMWESALNHIKPEPIQRLFELYYPMAAPLALMTRKNMLRQKADEDKLYLSLFEQRMLRLVSTEDYASKIVTITNTTKDHINTVLRDIMLEGETGGYGVDKVKTLLKDAVKANFRGNAMARAKVIAQTEMIGASNKASMFAADSTGLEYRKYWSTSHKGNVRASHIQCEMDSIQRGGLRKDEPFINGLMFPGDPRGDASEICNCYCCLITEIV